MRSAHWFFAAITFFNAPALAQTSDDSLARLFSELGSRGERHARFSERKFSTLLKVPLESSGTLVFRAPDILEKQTLTPQRESVRIEGNAVTYEGAPVRGAAPRRTFALSDAPLLAALIESLRATLAGDLPTLRRHYQVAWTAPQGKDGWQISLVPRDRGLLEAVSKIVLRGAGGELGAVEIIEAGGDLTLLSITPVTTPSPTAPAAPPKK